MFHSPWLSGRSPLLSLHALLLAACASPPPPAAATPASTAAPSVPPPTAPSAVAVVQAQVDAYNAHDLDAFVGTYADDVVIARRRDNKILTEGKPALRETYAKAFATVPHIHATIAERKLDGDHVVLDHEMVSGAPNDAGRDEPRDAGWVRYEVEQGVIRRVEFLGTSP